MEQDKPFGPDNQLPAQEQKHLPAAQQQKRLPAGKSESLFSRISTSKRILWSLLALLLLTGVVVGILAVRNSTQDAPAQKATYYCPMHPQVRSDKPGDCPICGMALVPLAGSTGREMDTIKGIMVSSEAAVKANVATVKVRIHDFVREIQTVGTVNFNERGEELIASRIRGRIERLYANATGDYIRAGQALYEIYSPDLLNAQQEYLVSLRSFAAATKTVNSEKESLRQHLVTAGRERLLIYGMTPGQVEKLERSGISEYTSTVYAKRSGVVIEKLVQEGAYIDEGTSLLQLADLSSVWIDAELFQEDVSFVYPSMAATVTSNEHRGKKVFGKIIFVSPVANPVTRTVSARIVVDNPNYMFKPETIVDIALLVNMGRRLGVPASAVIRGGQTDYVWIRRPEGDFVRRTVKLGSRSPSNFYQVLEGLIAGEEVAVSGAFLIDSEHEFAASNPMEGMNMDAPDAKSKASGSASGVVRNIDIQKQTITLDHGTIPGVMGAMTMPFKVSNAGFLTSVKIGDKVQFTVTRTENGEYVISSIFKRQ